MGILYIRVGARKFKNFREVLQKLSVKEKFCSGKVNHVYTYIATDVLLSPNKTSLDWIIAGRRRFPFHRPARR